MYFPEVYAREKVRIDSNTPAGAAHPHGGPPLATHAAPISTRAAWEKSPPPPLSPAHNGAQAMAEMRPFWPDLERRVADVAMVTTGFALGVARSKTRIVRL